MHIFIFLVIVTHTLLISVQSLNQSRFDLPKRFDIQLSVVQFKPLEKIYKPVDLGTGTPDMLPPPFLQDAFTSLAKSSNASVHRYQPSDGLPKLRKEIGELYSILLNRTLDSKKNVMISLGTTGALYTTLLIHTLPGEEWIVIEPAFENYFNQIESTGGIVRPIRLKPRKIDGKVGSGDLVFDKDEVRKAFNSKTKGIIINNPNNPTGKIFTKEELLFIAKLAVQWDTLIVSDEVYEWMIFVSNMKFTRIASLGNEIFSRTITLSSMSKTYFATGWRIGWAVGPSKLIRNLMAQQPVLTYSLPSHAQFAAADGLRKMRLELGHQDSYFINLAKSLKRKRNFILDVLSKIGVESIVPQSSFYVLTNWTRLQSRSKGFEREEGHFKDVKFIKWLIRNVGVSVSPGTAYYTGDGKSIGEYFVRFCYAKKFETLQRAVALLLDRFG